MSKKTKPTTKRRPNAEPRRKVAPRYNVRLEAKCIEALVPDDKDGKRVICCDLIKETSDVPLGGVFFALVVGEDDLSYIHVHPNVLDKGPEHLRKLVRKKVFRIRDDAHFDLDKADALEHYAQQKIKVAWPHDLYT